MIVRGRKVNEDVTRQLHIGDPQILNVVNISESHTDYYNSRKFLFV